MARFTAGSAGFVYILLGRVVFVYFFRISPVKLKFSMTKEFENKTISEIPSMFDSACHD